VVDDEPSVGKYVSEVLQLGGYEVKCFQESLLALAYMTTADPPPDLVVTDIRMPQMDGIALLRQLRAAVPDLPVVLLSAFYEPSLGVEAVQAGAADYLFKPARPAEILSLVAKHIRERQQHRKNSLQSALADFASGYQPRFLHRSAGNGHCAAAEPLFQALGFKRYETMQHSMRVAGYAVLLGKTCHLRVEQLQDLERGALLHDIGKMAIPRNILLKPGPLTDREWEVMRTHPQVGAQLLAGLPEMCGAAEVVHAHHERFNGGGYPRGLRGDQIPIGARLFSIVDTVDAITSDRAYRSARSFDVAAGELREAAGTQFDPALVETYLGLPREDLLAIREQFPDAP